MFPYRWTVKTAHINIRHFLLDIKYGVCNIVRWIPIIWGDFDYDWEPLAKIMEYKFRRMSNIFENGTSVNSKKYSRQTLICAELLKRLQDDEFIRPINRPNALRHQIRMREWEQMLGRYIGKYFRTWWD